MTTPAPDHDDLELAYLQRRQVHAQWAPFLAVPSHIKVYPDGQFWRIGAVRFDQEQAAA
mgnify:CR=1 FL=1